MRVVLDTNVIYSALRSKTGASNALMRKIGEEFDIALSVPLVFEYESVLKRQALAIGYTAGDVDILLDYLCATVQPQPIHYLWRPLLRDPKDDMVLELAVNAGCQRIVTFNSRDFARSESLGIQSCTPAEFLALLGGKP